MPNTKTNETYYTDCFDYAGTDLNTKHAIKLLLQNDNIFKKSQ